MNFKTPSHEPSRNVFFHQGCPVCGRRLEINVALLGRRVYCQHCGGGFVALDESLGGTPVAGGVSDTALKVDALLERAAHLLEQAAGGTERVRP